MRIGVVFPQVDLGSDPADIRAYAQAVEAMGYQHILVYDHVLGADISKRPNWPGPYTSEHQFHEPFVLFGYLSAVTQRIELVTGVLVLPQRQTALVAKQAAEVDVLSGGRLRLGIGVGWNPVEYEALGQDFHTRGAQSEEQIALLRALWTNPVVTFKERWHTIDAAGINPLPVQRPIPIWIGGYAEATLKRVARIADGWFPARPPDKQAHAMMAQLREYAQQAGRSPGAIGIEPRLSLAQVPEAEWHSYVDGWRSLGATHFSINTMGMGLATAQDHVGALRRVIEVLR